MFLSPSQLYQNFYELLGPCSNLGEQCSMSTPNGLPCCGESMFCHLDYPDNMHIGGPGHCRNLGNTIIISNVLEFWIISIFNLWRKIHELPCTFAISF